MHQQIGAFREAHHVLHLRGVAADDRDAAVIVDAVAVGGLDRIVIDEEGFDLQPVAVVDGDGLFRAGRAMSWPIMRAASVGTSRGGDARCGNRRRCRRLARSPSRRARCPRCRSFRLRRPWAAVGVRRRRAIDLERHRPSAEPALRRDLAEIADMVGMEMGEQHRVDLRRRQL